MRTHAYMKEYPGGEKQLDSISIVPQNDMEREFLCLLAAGYDLRLMKRNMGTLKMEVHFAPPRKPAGQPSPYSDKEK